MLISKYADHLPLYRHAQTISRQGINLDRSMLSHWVGRAAFELRPVFDALIANLKRSTKLFIDETRAPVTHSWSASEHVIDRVVTKPSTQSAEGEQIVDAYSELPRQASAAFASFLPIAGDLGVAEGTGPYFVTDFQPGSHSRKCLRGAAINNDPNGRHAAGGHFNDLERNGADFGIGGDAGEYFFRRLGIARDEQRTLWSPGDIVRTNAKSTTCMVNGP